MKLSTKLYFLTLLICAFCSTKAQDVHSFSLVSPGTGCNLPSNQIIEVLLRNDGPAPIVTPVNVTYQINGGTPITESTTILTGGTSPFPFVTFSFSTPADFSAPGIYTVTFYTDHPAENNTSNDTLTTIVICHAPTVAGTTSGSTTLCSSSNSGSINLSGITGDVVNWESSLNQSSWTSITNTTTTQTYSNLTATTYYRAVVKNGTCPAQTSTITTITIDPAPTGGTLSGGNTFCYLPNAGNLSLSGQSGNILSWEFSEDSGNSWTGIANTTTTQSYTNLDTTTIFRVRMGSGVCPVVFSTLANVIVHQPTVGGSVPDEHACIAGNSGTIDLTGNVGTVQFWEFSTNGGANWTTNVSTLTNLPYSNVTVETLYRANVKSGTCLASYSSIGTLFMDNLPVAGSISTTADTVCSGINSGAIVLSGNVGNVLQWETSLNNTSFSPVANTSTNFAFTNIENTTYYRAVIVNGVCPQTYTNVEKINTSAKSKGGKITGDSIICPFFNEGKLALVSSQGTVKRWESSLDNETFTEIVNPEKFLDYLNVPITTFYRVAVKSGVCPEANSEVFKLSTTGGPSVSISADTTIDVGDQAQLIAQGGFSYLWNNETTLDNNTLENPVASPTESTTYVVTVTDSKGCTNKDSVVVNVVYNYKFKISNIFTPNGDGYNDSWKVKNLEFYPSNEIFIYNRNGQEVFHATNYANDWDGTRNGNKLPDGVYFYTVKFSDSDTLLRGSITVLRGE